MSEIISEVPDIEREEGICAEEKFWDAFVKTDRFIDNWCVATPNPELNCEIDLFLCHLATTRTENLTVIDIGSGPVSILSRSTAKTKIDLKAVDPLAEFYSKILPEEIDVYDVSTPDKCEAEELCMTFGEQSFDVVHIRNALDHTRNPVKSLQEMYSIAKVGGYIIVHGFENEAIWEDWKGMHQWNLSLDGTDLNIESKSGEIVNSRTLFKTSSRNIYARKTQLVGGKEWLCFILQKKG